MHHLKISFFLISTLLSSILLSSAENPMLDIIAENLRKPLSSSGGRKAIFQNLKILDNMKSSKSNPFGKNLKTIRVLESLIHLLDSEDKEIILFSEKIILKFSLALPENKKYIQELNGLEKLLSLLFISEESILKKSLQLLGVLATYNRKNQKIIGEIGGLLDLIELFKETGKYPTLRQEITKTLTILTRKNSVNRSIVEKAGYGHLLKNY